MPARSDYTGFVCSHIGLQRCCIHKTVVFLVTKIGRYILLIHENPVYSSLLFLAWRRRVNIHCWFLDIAHKVI